MSDEWKEDFHDTVPHPDTIACLLKMGADPNFSIPHRDISKTASSVWLQTWSYMNIYYQSNLHPSWVTIGKLMIQHGAEINHRALFPPIEDGAEIDHTDLLHPIGGDAITRVLPELRVPESRFSELVKQLGVKKPPKTRSWSSWMPWSSQ